MAAYAGGDDGDSSETNTEQKIKQKNEGDGTLTNCAQNVLRAGGDQNCFAEPPLDFETAAP